MMFGALAGCAEPTLPAAPASPSAIIIIGGHPVVLTAQLRAIGNPDEKPLRAVVGTFKLLISGTEETGFVASWQLHFANPECETSTSFGGGAVMVTDPEDMPSPEDPAVIRLLAPGTVLGCGDNYLEGASAITEELIALLYNDPDEFVVAFFLEGGGVIGGPVQIGPLDLSVR